MLVYRVEKDGLGPYRHYQRDDHLWRKIDSYSGDRPGPYEDGVANYLPCKVITPKVYFGFKDIESLKKWFRGARSILRKNGFMVSVYDVPDKYVYTGKRQVGFEMCKAWLVKTIKIP